MNFVKVLINKSIKDLDHDFVYELPPEFLGTVSIGSLVSVPFGHTTEKGIVVGFADSPGEFHAKFIDGVINEDVICPEDLLVLANDLSKYYMNTTIGMLKAMIPAGVNLFGKAQKAKTEQWLVLSCHAGDVNSLRGKKQRELAEILMEAGEIPYSAAEDMGFSLSVCSGLVKNGFAVKDFRAVSRYSYRNLEIANSDIPDLTDDQEKALEQIRNRDDHDHRPILLHGVTGSGKTELYLRMIADTLEKGKQAIVLLPEIALTPQFISIFENRFKGKVALFHSRLSRGERRDAWFDFRNGTARIALGARSCVFAPAADLGLIIIDEEHEETYEQDTSPRFHARKAAELRCRYHNADLVLGSATPSFESYNKAKNGEYMLVSLPNRVGDTPLPSVSIVDMREELKAGWTEVLSRELLSSIKETIANGKQVILFLNRLGYHTFISCRDCGFVFRCPECGVAMSSFSDSTLVKCNRCGRQEEFHHVCPECGSRRIRSFGLGIERLEAIVKRLLPDIVIDRLDSEALKEKGNIDEVYQRMKSGKTQLLLGTRMIAKGWDFSNVDLIGIVAVDSMLNYPDFRSGEKTFQMVAQVAGRCGRSEKQGRVILQTYHPEEPVLLMGGMQDYDTYFRFESKKRAEFGYPPYSHMMKIIFTFPETDAEQKLVLRENARQCFPLDDHVRMFGPAESFYMDQRKKKLVMTFISEDLGSIKETIEEGILNLKRNKLINNHTAIQIETDPIHSV